MIRRYGDAKRPDQTYRRRPGVYAILMRGDQILLTHQAQPVPEYQLPGGGIDRGEHPMTALHREVFEETGWKIDIQRQLGSFRRFTHMPEYGFWAEKLCSIWLARPVYPLGPPQEPGHQAVWVHAYEALELLGNPGDRAMLTRLLEGDFGIRHLPRR